VADPGEGAFDDPAFGQDDEAVQVAALDDLHMPAAGLGDGGGHLWALIAAVGDDALDEGERAARDTQQVAGSVAVLHVGPMHDDAQQETERVDQDVALAARDLLARIEALRVDPSPPFCAALALWLSMIAVVGLASRPSASRAAT
jgi:hypothetical protein